MIKRFFIKNEKCDKKISELENEIKKLNSLIKEKEMIIKKTKEYLYVLEYELDKKDKEISNLKK